MIRFPLKKEPRKLKGVLIGQGSGPAERIAYLKKLVTSLIRHERIEGRADRLQETRAYAEQLINLAVQHGDRHEGTMNVADDWLLEKDLVHKLFKVLVPRYQHYTTSFTSVYSLPAVYPGTGRFQAVLELKGNPYPSVFPKQRETRQLLTNVLLSAAGRDFYKEQKEQKCKDVREQSTSSDKDTKIIDKTNETFEESENEVSKDSEVESGNPSNTR